MLNLDSTIDLAQFFKWWGSQLSFLVPQKFLDAVARGNSLILVEIHTETAKLSYLNNEQETFLGEFSLDSTGKNELQSIIESKNHYKEARVVLRVPEKLSVVQDVFLPAAAAENIDQVMNYELDRYTPFTREQVFFDFINIGSANEGALLHLILILVQKTSIENMYEQCLSLGLKPFYAESACHINLPEKVDPHYNLLPKELCQTVSKKPLFIMLASLALTLSLLAALLFLPLNMAENHLSELKKHVRKVEKQALEIEDSKRSIDYLYQGTQAIIDKKNAAPAMVDLINIVTQELPDDTWVSNLRFFKNTLQLSGQSGSASNLIGSLEKTKLFTNTRFISPVTKDKRSGLERFKISTEVLQKTNADTDIK